MLSTTIVHAEENNEYKEEIGEEVDQKDYGEPNHIYDYVMRLIGHLHSQALRYHVKENDWKLTVKIDIGKYQTTDFDITNDELMWLFNQGKDSLDKHLLDNFKYGGPCSVSTNNLTVSPRKFRQT